MDANIEKYRKSEATIYISGKKDLTVNVEQVSHDFLFGTTTCPLHDRDRGKVIWDNPEKLNTLLKRIGDVSDLVVINPFYWGEYEPEKGSIDPYTHRLPTEVAKWIKTPGHPLEGKIIKGHPLIFGNAHGTPTWLPKDSEKATEFLKLRIEREMTEFKYIKIWDVVNEYINARNFEEIDPQHVEKAFRWARETNPDATLVLNQVAVINNQEIREDFKRLVKRLIAENVPFDVIGLQAHLRGIWFDADVLYNVFDEFAQFGKPIHITEFDIPIGSKKNPTPILSPSGVKIGKWNEELQAEYLKLFYKVCFSHPAVESINYWGLYDTWLEGAGLLRKPDLSPTPAYNALYEKGIKGRGYEGRSL